MDGLYRGSVAFELGPDNYGDCHRLLVLFLLNRLRHVEQLLARRLHVVSVSGVLLRFGDEFVHFVRTNRPAAVALDFSGHCRYLLAGALMMAYSSRRKLVKRWRSL